MKRTYSRRLAALLLGSTIAAFGLGYSAFVSINSNQQLVLSVWKGAQGEVNYILDTSLTPNDCESLRSGWAATLADNDFIFCETMTKESK